MIYILFFRKCAFICAHYGMCAEFDSLIISLCKFTNLQNNPDVSIKHNL